MPRTPLRILVADDEPADCAMVREVIEQDDNSELAFVHDGEELLDYLHRRGKYADPQLSPRPNLILLDLNMPRKDGRTALAELKVDPVLRRIPVVVMTVSSDEADVRAMQDIGASTFISKPLTHEAWQSLKNYWLETVRLPDETPFE